MTEETKKSEKIYGSITLKQGAIVFATIIAIGIALFGICQLALLLATPQNITNDDIAGHWNTGLTEYEYVFIPNANIEGLELTFSIKDEQNRELQKIVKTIGNVTKGTQYTVKLSAIEIKDFDTLRNADMIELSVTGGTRKLI